MSYFHPQGHSPPGPDSWWCWCPGLNSDIPPQPRKQGTTPRRGHESLRPTVPFTHTPSRPVKDVTELTQVWLEPRTSAVQGRVYASSGLRLTSLHSAGRPGRCPVPPRLQDLRLAPQQSLCFSPRKAQCPLLPQTPMMAWDAPILLSGGLLPEAAGGVCFQAGSIHFWFFVAQGHPRGGPSGGVPRQTEAFQCLAKVRGDNG